MRIINVDLLRRTLDHIQASPQSWDQETWAVQYRKDGAPCGTAYCFAGWAVQFAGHQISFDTGSHTNWWNSRARETSQIATGESIDEVARQELGLDKEQAEALFDATNTLEDLRDIVDKLTAEAGTVAEVSR